jgi:ferrochelatase
MKLDKNCGVLLINMGGPSSLEEVEPFLREMFSDPYLMRLPLAWLLQKTLAKIIAGRRAAKSQERYAAIGGKSPLGAETVRQAAGLERLLSFPVAFAMRYTSPRVGDALRILKSRGVQRLVVIPLYPQYSSATTGSAIADFKLQNTDSMPAVIVQDHFDHPGFIDALFESLSQAFAKVDPHLKTHILFAAHSIPESYTQKGDPYVSQAEQTVKILSSKLPSEFTSSMAFQSRLGPVKWHGPSLQQELASVRAKAVEQLVVQPVSFVSENLETLYDLDIEFKRECEAAGIKKFIRAACPSDSEKYLTALADLAASAATAGEAK